MKRTWSVPELVADDTRVELAPVAGRDAMGRVVAAFRQVGVALPHQSRALAQRGTAVDWRSEVITAGDLVFTGTPAGVGPVKAGDVLHAGIDKVGELKVRIIEPV